MIASFCFFDHHNVYKKNYINKAPCSLPVIFEISFVAGYSYLSSTTKLSFSHVNGHSALENAQIGYRF